MVTNSKKEMVVLFCFVVVALFGGLGGFFVLLVDYLIGLFGGFYIILFCFKTWSCYAALVNLELSK